MNIKQIILATSLLTSLAGALQSQAATIRVEKWGDDVNQCGSKSAPCESLDFAINKRAGPNDRILVGPGHYAEDPVIDQNSLLEDLSGMKLESTNGMHTTIIQTKAANTNAIEVRQPRVRIGKRGKGFTIGGADSAGYFGIVVFTGADKVRIEGNRVMLNDGGMTVEGNKAQVRYNLVEQNAQLGILCVFCDKAMLRNNESRLNGDHGIQVSNSTGFQLLQNITAWNTGIGNLTEFGSTFYKSRDNVSEFNDSHGFTMVQSEGALVQGNIALLNHDQGFAITHGLVGNPPTIRNNAAIFNDGTGMVLGNVIQGRLEHNTLVDNGSGLLVIGASSYKTFKRNSTWGSGNGCGVTNAGGTFDYASHFFGPGGAPDDAMDADGHDAACPLGSLNGTASTKPAPFKAKKAARL